MSQPCISFSRSRRSRRWVELSINKRWLDKIVRMTEEFSDSLIFEFSNSLIFFCYDEEVVIQVYGYDKDEKNQVFADFKLTPDPSEGVLMNYKLNSKDPLSVVLNMKELSSKLDSVETRSITIIADVSKSSARFTLPDGSTSFKMPMERISREDRFFPNVTYTSPHAIANMPLSKFLDKCTAFSFCKDPKDYVLISIPERNILEFKKCPSNWNCWMDVNETHENLERIDVVTPLFCGVVTHQIHLKYLILLKYLMNNEPPASEVAMSEPGSVAMSQSASSDVNICLGSDYHVVKIQCNITPANNVTFYFGPKPSLIGRSDSSDGLDIGSLQLSPESPDPFESPDVAYAKAYYKWYGAVPTNYFWGMFIRRLDRDGAPEDYS